MMGQIRYITHLSKLDLSHNTLTGCLSTFLLDPHSGLPELEKLNLSGTALNKEDLKHLFSITQSNKLPNLWSLNLSANTLTGCLPSFLPDPHLGLPELQILELAETALNKNDLIHLTHLIQTDKLPGLKDLILAFNRFDEMETDVEHVIEACVTRHQRKLKLWMWGNYLSDAFVKTLHQRCAGSNIDIF